MLAQSIIFTFIHTHTHIYIDRQLAIDMKVQEASVESISVGVPGVQQCSVCLWLWISAGVQSVHPGYKGSSVRGPRWANGGRHGRHLSRRGLVLKRPLAHYKRHKTKPDRAKKNNTKVRNRERYYMRKTRHSSVSCNMPREIAIKIERDTLERMRRQNKKNK